MKASAHRSKRGKKRDRIAKFNKSIVEKDQRQRSRRKYKDKKPAVVKADGPALVKGTYCRTMAQNWKKTRESLGESQNWRCCYCGIVMKTGAEFANHPDVITIEHFVPRSRGGSNELDNLVAACRHCNNERGVLDVDPMTFFNMTPIIKRARHQAITEQRDRHQAALKDNADPREKGVKPQQGHQPQ